jgi:cysteinyl-tRNA synthetase
MALKLFNTLSRVVEEFVPLDPAGKRVGMYCCGPTVYDFAHIGNWRTFIFADLVRRYLEFRGYEVEHVMNITDVEDKIIKRVRETNSSLRDFTGRFEAAFLEDLKALNCRLPKHTPHATSHIPQITELIGRLVEKNIAYRTPDGSVYFSIEKYRAAGRTYGQLVKLNFDEMRVGERVRSDDYGKESVADFALWKSRTPEDGEVFWPSPWGEGRPGWHIECSAMSMGLLGPSFDLHLGGEDLAFPHHEDEIAQSEGAGVQPPGQRFVKCWLHGAHLMVEGKKMAKSLGNFFTLRDLTAKGFSGREIRYLLLTAHYRETFNFTLEGLEGARTALQRIDECFGRVSEVAAEPAPIAGPTLPAGFVEALDEDLNVSKAWGIVFSWIKDLNRSIDERALSPQAASAALNAWSQIETVFGIERKIRQRIALPGEAQAVSDQAPPPEIVSLLNDRQAARKARDFKRADLLREELKAKGWVIEDTPGGARLKRLG